MFFLREKSIGAIVFHREAHETRFLLLHYSLGHWDFPKGHVEENETDMQTLWRELEEETGLSQKTSKIIPGFLERITYFYKKESEAVFKEVLFYLMEAETEQVRLSPEHNDFLWLAIEPAIKKLTFPNAKQTLQKAQSFLKQKSLGAFS